MKQYLLSKLEDLEEKLNKDLVAVNKAQDTLNNGERFHYQVELISYWDQDGRVKIKLGRPTLEEALRFAIRDYRKQNGHESIRAHIFVAAVVNDIYLPIAEDKFIDLYNELLKE